MRKKHPRLREETATPCCVSRAITTHRAAPPPSTPRTGAKRNLFLITRGCSASVANRLLAGVCRGNTDLAVGLSRLSGTDTALPGEQPWSPAPRHQWKSTTKAFGGGSFNSAQGGGQQPEAELAPTHTRRPSFFTDSFKWSGKARTRIPKEAKNKAKKKKKKKKP